MFYIIKLNSITNTIPSPDNKNNICANYTTMHLMGMEHTVQDFNNKHIVSKANNLELPKHSIKHIDGECKLCSVTNIAMNTSILRCQNIFHNLKVKDIHINPTGDENDQHLFRQNAQMKKLPYFRSFRYT